jgi:hypothetical protein
MSWKKNITREKTMTTNNVNANEGAKARVTTPQSTNP